jgi:hypothetical protein
LIGLIRRCYLPGRSINRPADCGKPVAGSSINVKLNSPIGG